MLSSLLIVVGGVACYASGDLIRRGRSLYPRQRLAAHLLGLVGMALAGCGFWLLFHR
jgi:hypothetical protein